MLLKSSAVSEWLNGSINETNEEVHSDAPGGQFTSHQGNSFLAV